MLKYDMYWYMYCCQNIGIEMLMFDIEFILFDIKAIYQKSWGWNGNNFTEGEGGAGTQNMTVSFFA